jgi:Flp pilus assembly pilin Flp
MTEYAVVLALITAAIVATFGLLSGSILALFRAALAGIA